MKDKKLVLCTKNEDETYVLGMQLASLHIKCICLVGDLGSGKTVLSKGYAKGFAINGYITSPTFNIINKYEKDDIIFNHMDAYRIEDEEMLYDLGFEELFDDGNYTMIEWADNIRNSIPENAIWITIKKDDSDLKLRYFLIECNEKQLVKIGKVRVC